VLASVAGHGRQPVGEDVAPPATWARDADRFAQFPQRQPVQAGQAGEIGRDGFLIRTGDGDRQPRQHHQPLCLRIAWLPRRGGRDAAHFRGVDRWDRNLGVVLDDYGGRSHRSGYGRLRRRQHRTSYQRHPWNRRRALSPSQKCGKPPAWSKCFCAARDERKARTLTEAVIPAGLALLAAGGLFIEVRDATLIGPALPRIAEWTQWWLGAKKRR
jgi:hypothetical protein